MGRPARPTQPALQRDPTPADVVAQIAALVDRVDRLERENDALRDGAAAIVGRRRRPA